ncbi:hypothetical protein CONPUDRAFT_154865 [Coniophora puteana RWD-64-598 SS2]|uniref:Uncharacterized protein n=1 Tax=Coniophora puteana (strain RWD-64-598) TaxID=741705 RepID=A0A5M3MJM3_CONPW|nr:uncharacterized protein CONPUDRAFT_154865 [Coniophora puteana RWD-64-598 SS2]EIW79449.1 hypothetical protein CONPUDRAFT_154865 [Coniophora puteana RWD-64-598 SS2]
MNSNVSTEPSQASGLRAHRHHHHPQQPMLNMRIPRSDADSDRLETFLATRRNRDQFWEPFMFETVDHVSVGRTFRYAFQHLYGALQDSWDLECLPRQFDRTYGEIMGDYITTARSTHVQLGRLRQDLYDLLRAFGGAARHQHLVDEQLSADNRDDDDETSSVSSSSTSSYGSLLPRSEYFTAPSHLPTRPSSPITNGNGHHTPVTPPNSSADNDTMMTDQTVWAPTSANPYANGDGRDAEERGWRREERLDGWHWVRVEHLDENENREEEPQEEEPQEEMAVDEWGAEPFEWPATPIPTPPTVDNELAFFKEEPVDISLPPSPPRLPISHERSTARSTSPSPSVHSSSSSSSSMSSFDITPAPAHLATNIEAPYVDRRRDNSTEIKVEADANGYPLPIQGYQPSEELNQAATQYLNDLLLSPSESSSGSRSEDIEASRAFWDYPSPPFLSDKSTWWRLWNRKHPGPADPQSLVEIRPDWNCGEPVWIKKRNLGVSCDLCRLEGHVRWECRDYFCTGCCTFGPSHPLRLCPSRRSHPPTPGSKVPEWRRASAVKEMQRGGRPRQGRLEKAQQKMNPQKTVRFI